MKLMLTKKQWIYAGVAIVLAAMAMVMFCSKAKAAETKGQFFIPLSARYIEDFGVAGGIGYRFDSGLILMGQVSYDQFNAQSGSVAYQVNPCRTVQVPWSIPSSGHRGIEFTVGIPLTKKK